MTQQEPLASYKFEDSGVNNLCSLNDQNLFISSALNRSISVWDTRQVKPILYFKDIHFDTITSIDKFNT
jgi:WD40 repeat protein